MNLFPTGLVSPSLTTVNPLRGLTMARVVQELEAGQRGDYAALQWLYHTIEKRDATIRGAKRRIISSVLKLEWDIKIRSGVRKDLVSSAELQQRKLKESYRNLMGFRESLKHLVLCEFRGFSHLEKHRSGDGSVRCLKPVPQWHFCRKGIYGKWLFNADARQGGISGTPIDPNNFVIREIEDPINEIALIAATRKGLSSKDFDSHVARYGIPFVFWVLSDSMASALANDPGKLRKYQIMMRGIGSDGEGIFPGGKLEALDASVGSKDQNPFLQHLGHQDEEIVMAATSGKLTMLNDKTGLGGGNSKIHQKTFDSIASALAMEISETLHDQFDAPELGRLFPGEEPLVYFELAAKTATEVSKIVKNVKDLSDSGWEIDGKELSERTGYKLSRKADANSAPAQATPAGEEPAGVARQKNRAAAKLPETEEAVQKAADDLIRGGETAFAALFASALQTETQES